MTEMTGHCLCGGVKWISNGSPSRNLVCHCTDCQRATSAPFTAFIGLQIEEVEWFGDINHFESSPGTFRGFCPSCGTRLYFRSTQWPGEIHLHAATLSDPKTYEPTDEVVLRSKAPWLNHMEQIPKYHDFDVPPESKDA